jgi:hypothetical protein
MSIEILCSATRRKAFTGSLVRGSEAAILSMKS